VAEYLPTEIAAGVTLEIPITLTAYPASGWGMTLVLRGPQAIDLAGTADGDTHVLAADAATTAAWNAGAYWFSLRVTDGTDVVEVDAGELRITPDLASEAAGYDGRSHAQRVLTAIEAVIEGRATRDQERYRINNRELQRTPISDLIRLRDRYREEARRERAAAKGQSLLGRRVLTRF
jgi:hypothetical protein